MSFIMVDVEADGPAPGRHSMVSFGAVVVRPGLEDTFYGQVAPWSLTYEPDALAVSGHSREEHEQFPGARIVMQEFQLWLEGVSVGRPMFISDNNGFDWQWINYYFWALEIPNPFGHSSTNLGSLYKGMTRSTFKNFKHLRKTKHTHHPVDDSKGNAEALLHMRDTMRLDIKLV